MGTRRRPRKVVVLAAIFVAMCAAVAVWVKVTYYPSPVEGVCRSLDAEGSYAPVPGDVLEKAAETLEVRVADLAEPTTAQLAAAREELLQPFFVEEVNSSVACLVDYSRTGSPGDPDADPPVAPIIERNHVPALLVYRESETRISPCFGGGCGDEPTYTVHCAGFQDAKTGRTLRMSGCWGFREDY